MNLLENQMTLSSMEIRNSSYDDAINRLRDTQNLYPDSSILKTNISVAMCVKNLNQDLMTQQNQNEGKNVQLLGFLEKSILSAPLDYVGYYNMFNFHIKSNNFDEGLKLLIEAISALYLQKALSQQCQKIVSFVQKQYCSYSILVYLVKAIVHIKHQKYILAISELNWIVQNCSKLKDKLLALQMIKLIFQALQQKDKKHQIQLKILQLNTYINQAVQKDINDQTLYRLDSTFTIPHSQENIQNQLSKKLKQFSSLLNQTQIRNLTFLSKTNQLLFKKVSSSQILNSHLNKQFLYQQLKLSIIESPVYTKSESKKLSRSRKSQQFSINSSQQFGLTQDKQHKVALTSRKQEDRPQMRMSFSSNRNQLSPLLSQRDNNDSRRIHNSMNISGLGSKKKTQNIYPLQRNGQQVEIKLVMAQLTNNKQILGQMDPYCIIIYNNIKKQSSVVKGGGKQPRWKECFIFELTQYPSEVTIEVYDKENYFKRDDFIGSGKFILDKNGFIKVQLYQKQKQAGTIFFTIEAKD